MTFVQPSGKHDSCCLPLIFSTDSSVKGIRKKELCYINKSNPVFISIIKTEGWIHKAKFSLKRDVSCSHWVQVSPGAKCEPPNSDNLKWLRVIAVQVWGVGRVISLNKWSQHRHTTGCGTNKSHLLVAQPEWFPQECPRCAQTQRKRRTGRPLCHVWYSQAKPLRFPTTSLNLPQPGTAMTAPALPAPASAVHLWGPTCVPCHKPLCTCGHSPEPHSPAGTWAPRPQDASPRTSAEVVLGEAKQSRTTNTLQVSQQAKFCSAKIRTFLCLFWIRFRFQNFNTNRADSCHRNSQMHYWGKCCNTTLRRMTYRTLIVWLGQSLRSLRNSVIGWKHWFCSLNHRKHL